MARHFFFLYSCTLLIPSFHLTSFSFSFWTSCFSLFSPLIFPSTKPSIHGFSSVFSLFFFFFSLSPSSLIAVLIFIFSPSAFSSDSTYVEGTPDYYYKPQREFHFRFRLLLSLSSFLTEFLIDQCRK